MPTPDALEAGAAKRKQTTTAGYTAVQAVVKVRDAKSDETFWIGRFDGGGELGATCCAGLLARRTVGECHRWCRCPQDAFHTTGLGAQEWIGLV